MSEGKHPVSNRPLKNVELIDSAKRYFREQGYGAELDRMEALRWWQKPLYWDRNDEPRYIGDVLFMVFVYSVPLMLVAGAVGMHSGIRYLLTDGLKPVLIAAAILTAGLAYFLHRKRPI